MATDVALRSQRDHATRRSQSGHCGWRTVRRASARLVPALRQADQASRPNASTGALRDLGRPNRILPANSSTRSATAEFQGDKSTFGFPLDALCRIGTMKASRASGGQEGEVQVPMASVSSGQRHSLRGLVAQLAGSFGVLALVVVGLVGVAPQTAQAANLYKPPTHLTVVAGDHQVTATWKAPVTTFDPEYISFLVTEPVRGALARLLQRPCLFRSRHRTTVCTGLDNGVTVSLYVCAWYYLDWNDPPVAIACTQNSKPVTPAAPPDSPATVTATPASAAPPSRGPHRSTTEARP